MQELLSYQSSFYKAIFSNDESFLQNAIGPIEDLRERFNIYSNNVFSSLKNVLKDDFPIVRKILGEQKFNQVSFSFVRKFPPKSGCLLEYGRDFPSFLEPFLLDFPYIKDVAELEWAKKEIYYKSNTTPLDLQVICGIPAEQHISLTFEFPKAIFFHKSNFDLENIFASKEEHREGRTPSFSLMIRPRFKIYHYWLSVDEFHFLLSLYEAKTLGEAYGDAAIINPNFDLSEALSLALSREYFTKAEVSS